MFGAEINRRIATPGLFIARRDSTLHTEASYTKLAALARIRSENVPEIAGRDGNRCR